MNLDEYLTEAKARLPKWEELASVAEHLGITFALNGTGQPVLRACPDCREEALVLAKLFKREPFRSMVIAAKIGQEKEPEAKAETEPEQKKEEPPATPLQRLPPPAIPAGARLFVADRESHMNESRRGEPYMWTWEGAKTWYYVAEHPVPMALVQVA
jgi:hypothetical protein